MRRRKGLVISVLFLGALAIQGARAQELSVDPNALDSTSASAKHTGRKASKARPAAPSAKADDKSGKGENRQFGELEGWSPGKSPPKPKDKDEPKSTLGGSAPPVSVTPSGGMSVGMPF
jgi:hypothetical protein